MEWLDQKLWLGPEEKFLAHGLAGGAHDALQPVLLSASPGNGNDAECLMAVDGAEVAASEVKSRWCMPVVFATVAMLPRLWRLVLMLSPLVMQQ